MLDGHAVMALEPAGAGYAFGRFVLQQRRRQLLADGEPVEIGSRAFDVLLALVEADGTLVTKAAIRTRVWPDVIVDENNLQVQVSSLRRALGADRDWIATIPGRGHRFIGQRALHDPVHDPATLITNRSASRRRQWPA